jgi:hypothetical protein
MTRDGFCCKNVQIERAKKLKQGRYALAIIHNLDAFFNFINFNKFAWSQQLVSAAFNEKQLSLCTFSM